MFDVGPKVLASQQRCQITPNPISLLGKLKSQPERKLVILDRMAAENGVLGDGGSGLERSPTQHVLVVLRYNKSREGFWQAYNPAHYANSKERWCPVAKSGHTCCPASSRVTGLSNPLGRVLDRKKIGSFVFVNHHYPKLAKRTSHSHPWLHLTSSAIATGEEPLQLPPTKIVQIFLGVRCVLTRFNVKC